MTEPAPAPRKHVRLPRWLRLLAPSLATVILIGLLVFTILFTAFDWQWVAFLSGILIASVLSLVSASWKSSWRLARRTAEAAHFRERLSAEKDLHRNTREQLDREAALHRQDRERLATESEGRGLAEERAHKAEDMVRMLTVNLREIAAVVDAEGRYRFHTPAYASWIGARGAILDGRMFDEPLAPDVAAVLRAPLAAALGGRAGHIELAPAGAGGAERPYAVVFAPQRSAANQVIGVAVLAQGAAPVAEAVAETLPAEPEKEPAVTFTDEAGHTVYLNSLTEELTGWRDPRERIRAAIDAEEFDLYVQDIVALDQRTVPPRMQEVLIRMRDEELNLIPPGAFLPIAERFGMMPDIDRLVVRKVLAFRAACDPALRAQLPLLCINIASATLEDASFVDFVAAALQRHQAAGADLCFEIEDPDAAIALSSAARVPHGLKGHGCRLTLAGFGAAGISFEQANSLSIDFLKIDGRLILQLERDPVAAAMVKSIQRACEAMGVRAIAELVESPEVSDMLKSIGVHYVQGFGIARPCPLTQPG